MQPAPPGAIGGGTPVEQAPLQRGGTLERNLLEPPGGGVKEFCSIIQSYDYKREYSCYYSPELFLSPGTVLPPQDRRTGDRGRARSGTSTVGPSEITTYPDNTFSERFMTPDTISDLPEDTFETPDFASFRTEDFNAYFTLDRNTTPQSFTTSPRCSTAQPHLELEGSRSPGEVPDWSVMSPTPADWTMSPTPARRSQSVRETRVNSVSRYTRTNSMYSPKFQFLNRRDSYGNAVEGAKPAVTKQSTRVTAQWESPRAKWDTQREKWQSPGSKCDSPGLEWNSSKWSSPGPRLLSASPGITIIPASPGITIRPASNIRRKSYGSAMNKDDPRSPPGHSRSVSAYIPATPFTPTHARSSSDTEARTRRNYRSRGADQKKVYRLGQDNQLIFGNHCVTAVSRPGKDFILL